MRVVPLVRAESRQDEENETDQEKCQDDIEPDIWRQRVEEGEDSRVLGFRNSEEDSHTQVHPGFGEVNHLLTGVADCERSCCQVGSL